MPAPLSTLLGSMQKSIQQLSLAQRVFAVLLAAGIVLGAVALGQWAAKPTMSPLYTNLSATDAAAIVDQLNASGIDYQLAAGGTTVMVPNSQLYDTRLMIAGAGLPANSDAGYALLDGMSMTSSEFQQQVTYQRALEGELAKTITAMDGVQTASVKLAIPQDSVFVAREGRTHGVGLHPDQPGILGHDRQCSGHRPPRLRVDRGHAGQRRRGHRLERRGAVDGGRRLVHPHAGRTGQRLRNPGGRECAGHA